jgi:hypothetical protein
MAPNWTFFIFGFFIQDLNLGLLIHGLKSLFEYCFELVQKIYTKFSTTKVSMRLIYRIQQCQ